MVERGGSGMLGSGKLGYGMARRSGYGKFWRGELWSGEAWRGGRGAFRCGAFRCGAARLGGLGWVWRSVVRCGAVWHDETAKLMRRWWAVVAHYANIKKLLEN